MLQVLRRVEAGDRKDEPGVRSTGRGGGSWSIIGRLSDADICEIVDRFHAGEPKHRLAQDYGMSVSTLKRLLRRPRPSAIAPLAPASTTAVSAG